MNSCFQLLLLCFVCIAIAQNEAASANDNERSNSKRQYCVIGAGPGGLQMGYFLHKAGRDYVVFEKGPRAGTFYNKFPIHRKLISLNKIHTGKTNKEFNFRHDWNSLVSDNETLVLTRYTEDFFPKADVIVQYFEDFANFINLNMQYNTTISGIRKTADKSAFNMEDQNGNMYTCKYVIAASGVGRPNNPEFEGSQYMTGYEDLLLDLKEYEGKNVLIIGHGNSAFEVAEHIMPVTNSVHMMARNQVKPAWQTHYVGDLRAVNMALLDTAYLKTLDTILSGEIESFSITKSPINGRLYLKNRNSTDYERDNSLGRNGYDMIIRCTGFSFDDSIFHENTSIQTSVIGASKNYPRMNNEYESMDVDNLYFAGAVTHALDFRKSAGAFIHGYRYSARALHRLLEWKNHGVKWPYVHFDNVVDVVSHIAKRFNEASDIYQMFGVMCDVVIYNKDKTEATYLEAMPCSLATKIEEVTGHKVPGAFLIVSTEYGKEPVAHFRPLAKYAHLSHFLHPMLYHYESPITEEAYENRLPRWILPLPDRYHHVVEDFLTKFDGHRSHLLSLRHFIEDTTGHDLRFFYADQCLKLALTANGKPFSCQGNQKPIEMNVDMEKKFTDMPSHVLPFQFTSF